MEHLINWLVIMLLGNLFMFVAYIRERRKRKAWETVHKEMIRRLENSINQQANLINIDNILADAENNSNL